MSGFNSVDSMLFRADAVVLARIDFVLAEQLDNPRSDSFSVYSATVLDALSAPSATHVGDSVAIWQSGGVSHARVQPPPGDELLHQGCTYLFVLQEYHNLPFYGMPEPWGKTYESAPWGHFILDPTGHLRTVSDAWACVICYGPKAIDGRTIDEAYAVIRAALARLPSPAP